MLIHTSGNIDDHNTDKLYLDEILSVLRDPESPGRNTLFSEVLAACGDELSKFEKQRVINFIKRNAIETKVVILNSGKGANKSGDAQNPPKCFTFIIGGNVVSRGLTLNNLLSMYFTRGTTSKLQQDTYIQRARMFGNRGGYFEDFNLTIPEELFLAWHDCFSSHELSLEESKMGRQPVWWGNSRVAPAAGGSFVKGSIFTKVNGTMFDDFDYDPSIVDEVIGYPDTGKIITLDELSAFAREAPDNALPNFIVEYVRKYPPESRIIAWYPPHSIKNMKENKNNGDDFSIVFRKQGLWGQFERDLKRGKRFHHLAEATHHFRLFFNTSDRARLAYKIRSPSDKQDNVTYLK